MNQNEKILLSNLVNKYNSILLHSVQIAVAEDLINLIIVNGDDKGFELKNIVNNKEEFKQFVVSEFFKLNSGSILSELGSMEDTFVPKQRKNRILQ